MKVKTDKTSKNDEKEMTDKYYVAEEVSEQIKNIMTSYPDMFPHFTVNEIFVLFKVGKNNPDKKHVNVKIVKEPMNLLTSKKVIFMVTDAWWKDEGYEERSKALIEALVSVEIAKGGKLKKRDFDIKTFSEFVKGGKLDYSRFSKILNGEKEDLVLS